MDFSRNWKYARWLLVHVLLFCTLTKTIGRQLHLKLTKFTRRSSDGVKSVPKKVFAGFGFLRDMVAYNREVVRCSRRCLVQLLEQRIREAYVYGEKDVRAILCDLSFEIPVHLKVIVDSYEANPQAHAAPPAAGNEKIIVASLVNVHERVRYLRERGVDDQQIVLLS